MTKLPGAVAGARIVGERFAPSRRQQNPDGRMPLMDHIRELRNRVVKSLALVAGMTVGFIFFSQAWHVIERPLCTAHIRNQVGCHTLGVNQLVLNGPLDPLYLRVKVALIVGVILSSPEDIANPAPLTLRRVLPRSSGTIHVSASGDHAGVTVVARCGR